MKKQDITVGAAYATSRNRDWRSYTYSVTKVIVTGPPVSKKSGSYPYTAKTIVPVKDEQGREYQIEVRHIREPWETYAEWKRAADRLQLDAAKQAERLRVERASQALRLAGLLEDVGVEVTKTAIHSDGEANWLAEHGFLLYLDETSYTFTLAYLVAPLAEGVRDYVATGSALKVRPVTLLEILESQK